MSGTYGQAQCGETRIHEPHVWGVDATWGRMEWECTGLDGSEPDYQQPGTEDW